MEGFLLCERISTGTCDGIAAREGPCSHSKPHTRANDCRHDFCKFTHGCNCLPVQVSGPKPLEKEREVLTRRVRVETLKGE